MGSRACTSTWAVALTGEGPVTLPLIAAGADLKVGASAPESAPGWRGESPLQVNVTCNRPATASW